MTFSVERQLMWDRLLAVVEEQAQIILRTAFSSAVSEAGDLSAGVFDTQGRMLAQASTGTPGHVNSMAQAVGHFLERFPLAGQRPGDVYITNDPWLATGHLHDFTVVTPTCLDGKVIALFASTCHVVDIGGRGFGADAREIFEEGLAIPPLLLASEGELNQTLLQIIRANVREPLLVEGDLHSLIACNERGGVRLLEMMREFGLTTLDPLADWIIQTSREGMLRIIGSLPAGTWSHHTEVDGYDSPLTLAATLTIGPEGMHVDLTGTSGPSAFGINVPMSYTAAYVSYGIRCVVGSHIPNNAGSLSAITVSAPPGCVLNAQRPSPVAARGTTGHMIPDLVLGCLHKAGIASAPAESCSCIWGPMLYGQEPSRRFALVSVCAGGMGARHDGDGLSATGFPSGVRCTPVEVLESVSPILIWRKQLREDSGGAGRYRGGLGQSLEFAHVEGHAFSLSAMFERVEHPAAGRHGGNYGAAGHLQTNAGRQLTPKGRQTIEPGESLLLEIPGGGGFGAPHERDPERVAQDVREGRVSRDAARHDYGVVVLDDGTVDAAATRTARLSSMGH
jgi:N-methylhydantoinase B